MVMALTAGQVSDHVGARIVYPYLPKAQILIADKGDDSDAWRAALRAKGIEPCIPPLKHRKIETPYDKELYKQRHKVEKAFAKIKDWRRVATRYDRCADIFMAAITIAATIIFWINQ